MGGIRRNAAPLCKCRKSISPHVRRLDFKLENDTFKPHITLALKWKGENPFSMESFFTTRNMQNIQLEVSAEKVVLYRQISMRTQV